MFNIEGCIAFITNNVSKKIADAFNERLLKEGISRVQWIAMFYLYKFNQLSQIELGQKMDLQQSTIARLIDRMERDGLVKREKDENDKRITNIRLTEAGEELTKRGSIIGEKVSETITKGITSEELEIFNSVLDKMLRNSEHISKI